jgi:hypothetical protein
VNGTVVSVLKSLLYAGLLCFAILCIHSWIRPNSLFISYTAADVERHTHQRIAVLADEYLRAHPDEMCISSLELSATGKDEPYFHIILRSNMHRSYEGDYHNVLNPEYVFDDSNDALVAAAARAGMDTGMSPPISSRIDVMRASDSVLQSIRKSQDTAASAVHAHHYSRVLTPPANPQHSSEWKLNTEEKTFCQYVYLRRVGIVTRIWRAMWPSLDFNPRNVPTQDVYRKKKITVRYRDLVTFAWVERTFSHEHASCIQHYMDVFNRQLTC